MSLSHRLSSPLKVGRHLCATPLKTHDQLTDSQTNFESVFTHSKPQSKSCPEQKSNEIACFITSKDNREYIFNFDASSITQSCSKCCSLSLDMSHYDEIESKMAKNWKGSKKKDTPQMAKYLRKIYNIIALISFESISFIFHMYSLVDTWTWFSSSHYYYYCHCHCNER